MTAYRSNWPTFAEVEADAMAELADRARQAPAVSLTAPEGLDPLAELDYRARAMARLRAHTTITTAPAPFDVFAWLGVDGHQGEDLEGEQLLVDEDLADDDGPGDLEDAA